MLRTIRNGIELGKLLRLKHNFAEFQGKKKVDMSKSSIKLMITPVQNNIHIDKLKLSHQYIPEHSFKLYLIKANQLNLGQACKLIIQADFIQFEFRDGMPIFLQLIKKSLNVVNQSQLNLNVDNNLSNFLSVVCHLQNITSTSFIRVIMSILAKYAQTYNKIQMQDYYSITSYLTQRGYFTKGIIKHFKSLQFNKQKFIQKISHISGDELLSKFKQLSFMLESILNIQSFKNEIKLQDVKYEPIKQQLKDEIIDAFFLVLQNKLILPHLTKLTRPCRLIIPKLFLTHKSRYITLIKKILNPLFFHSVKISDQLIESIFDNLLMYSQDADKQDIQQILAQYTKCYNVDIFDNPDYRKIKMNMILLWQKYEFSVNSPFYKMIFKDFRGAVQLKTHEKPMLFTKNKIIYLNLNLNKLFQLIILLKNMTSSQHSYNFFVEKLEKRINYLSHGLDNKQDDKLTSIILNKYNNEKQKINSNDQKVKKNQKQAKSDQKSKGKQQQSIKDEKSTQKNRRQLSFFQCYMENNKFSLQEFVKNTKQLVKSIQSSIEVFVTSQMRQNSTPITSLIFPGVALKIFLQSLFILKTHHQKRYDLQSILEQNSQFIQILEKNKSYPGLIQAAYLYYYSAKYDKQSSSKILPAFQKFIKSNQTTMNKYFYQLINESKNNKSTQQGQPLYRHYIQFLSTPLRKRPDFYNDDKKVLNSLKNYKIIQHWNKYQNLRNKITQELIQMKKTSNFNIYAISIHADFPFISDYLIVVNNKSYVIMFMDPAQKQLLQPFVKKQIYKKKETLSNENLDEVQKKHNFMTNYLKLCIKHFRQSNNVILISKQQEIKNNLNRLK